ncbi:ABC transporter ATP-binding protein [unidentified bacterial endosymbiont]|uniref:ABC transporter ATP-binding protein n=1 Tax=unidentified bacterial endosymbiont TaxID=2355 RepID=UPI00209EEE2E|nr:ATP-binding cassette domain-containing protein [unidentified bacterial endosymbiont]
MLQLQQITYTFAGALEPVLNDFNLQLARGDFCVIIGANGSGKSTLMQIIAGALAPDSGQIRFKGAIASAEQRRLLVSHLVQAVDQGTLPELTILENMVLSQRRGRRPRLAFYQRAESTIRQILQTLGQGLDRHLHAPLATLSGGQRQMVALLMALTAQPQLLLLDEHTAALDPHSAQRVMHHTAHCVAESQLTTVMITHNLEDAIQYGNRLILLQQGRIAYEIAGAAKAALTRQALLQRFLHTLSEQKRSGRLL